MAPKPLPMVERTAGSPNFLPPGTQVVETPLTARSAFKVLLTAVLVALADGLIVVLADPSWLPKWAHAFAPIVVAGIRFWRLQRNGPTSLRVV